MDVTGQAARVGTRCHFGTLLPRWHNFPVAISELLSLISYSNDIGTATTAERYVRSVNVIGCTSSDRWPIADVTAACLGDGRQISVIFRWLLDVSFSIGQNRVRHTGAGKPPTALSNTPPPAIRAPSRIGGGGSPFWRSYRLSTVGGPCAASSHQAPRRVNSQAFPQ